MWPARRCAASSPRLPVDHRGDFLLEQPSPPVVQFLDGTAAQGSNADVHECSDVSTAELGVDRGTGGAQEFADADIQASQAVSVHNAGRVPADQGAVEVEGGDRSGPGRGGFDGGVQTLESGHSPTSSFAAGARFASGMVTTAAASGTGIAT